MQLRELGVDLEQEDNAAGFLGVTLKQDPETGLLEMKQTGQIKRVIKVLELDDGLVIGKYTPSEFKALVKNINGVAASGCSRPDGQPQVDKQGFKSLQLEATRISVVKTSSE